MQEIINKIDQLQDCIFKYNTQNIFNLINELISKIIEVMPLFQDINISKLNTVLEKINKSLENNDYLLLADILEYELKNEFTQISNTLN